MANSSALRDDILFFNKDINIRTYGSQGQKRTIALSLKLAEIELVKKIINDTPVLLLDDVTSELDLERIKLIFEKINDYKDLYVEKYIDDAFIAFKERTGYTNSIIKENEEIPAWK